MSSIRLRLLVLLIVVLGGLSFVPVDLAESQSSAIADSFDFPMDLTQRTRFIPYGIKNPGLGSKLSKCYNVPVSDTWHAGEDWMTGPNTPIRAVANGVVKYAQFANYPGAVVIIEHTLPDNSKIYSMYGHLDHNRLRIPLVPGATQVVKIRKGDIIADGPLYQTFKTDNGTIDNTHLHWEMRYDFDLTGIKKAFDFKVTCSGIPGPGYTYPGHPDYFVANGADFAPDPQHPVFRWTDPTKFVNSFKGPQVIGTIPLPCQPFTLGLHTSLHRIYATCPYGDEGQVIVIDGNTQQVIKIINIGGKPVRIAVNETTNRAYITNQGNNTVSVIDAASNTLIQSFEVPLEKPTWLIIPREIAVNPVSNRVFVSETSKLLTIDGNTNQVINTVNHPYVIPFEIEVNPVTNRFYTASLFNNGVWVGDATSGDLPTLIKGIEEETPREIAINPITNRIYAPLNWYQDDVGTIWVIDGETNTITSRISVSEWPSAAAIDPVRSRIFVTDNTQDGLFIIDGNTNEVMVTESYGMSDMVIHPPSRRLYGISGESIVVLQDR